MTGEEKELINGCRIMIVGSEIFIGYVQEELNRLGFNEICNVSALKYNYIGETRGILIEFTGNGPSQCSDATEIPTIYPFDFIGGAGAIVLFSGDERKWLEKPNVRLWAAEYMSGYCAFWNISGCEWLHEAIPAIKAGETSDLAQKTAAHLCALIAANIAVGHDVKHYPRFYLVESGEK